MSTDNDKLRELFKQLPIEGPSMGFENKLMLKVTELAEAKARKKRFSKWLLISLSILVGLAGVLRLTWFLLDYYDIEIESPQYSWTNIELDAPKVEFPFMLVMFAVGVLLLLSLDLLLRRHRFIKHSKVES